MEKARCNTELYSNLRAPLNNVKPSNFWGSHQFTFGSPSLFYRKPIIIGDKRRERNGVNKRIADNQHQGFYSKHPTFTFQLLFLPPFIHKVCYNEHAKSNEAVTNFVAVNRYLFNELLLGFNAGYF